MHSETFSYVFSGEYALAPVMLFVEKYGRDKTREPHQLWTGFEDEGYTQWERDGNTDCVRAFRSTRKSGELAGLMCVSFQRHHIRIENVMVAPDCRRQKIASSMFFRMMMDPRTAEYRTVSAICPDNNDPMIAWLKHCKFRAISVLPAKKPDERDHYLFTWSWANMDSGEKSEVRSNPDSVPDDYYQPCPFDDPEGLCSDAD